MLRTASRVLPASRPVGDPVRRRVTLATLLVANMAFGFQQTAITPALPLVQHDLAASRTWTAWLYSGYLIVAAVTPAFMGKVGDRFGKQRIYVLALAVFLLGSLGAALSPTIALVVLCRVVQGVGGAVFPLSFSIVRDELPPMRLPAGIGLLTGGFGLGAVGGFGIGGLIAEVLSWRWVFGVGAVALAVAVVLAWVAVPRSPVRTERGLDTPGACLFGGALAALILAITEGPGSGWTSPIVVGLLLLAVAAAAGWVVRELRTVHPMIDLHVLGSRTVLLTNVASVLNGYALFGVSLLLPFLLETSGSAVTAEAFGFGAGPLLTGLVLLPRAFGQAAGGPASGYLARRAGQAGTFAVGMVLMAAGAAGLAVWRGQLWHVLLELAALGVGFGLSVSASGTLVTRTVDPTEAGVATAINSVLRRVGGAIGAQVGVALLAAPTLPGARTPPPDAFSVAFVVSAVVALAGAACALFITPSGRTSPGPRGRRLR